MKPTKSQFDEAPEWWSTHLTPEAMDAIQGPEDVGSEANKDAPEPEDDDKKQAPPF